MEILFLVLSLSLFLARKILFLVLSLSLFLARKILFLVLSLVLSLVLFRACLVLQLRMLDQLCPITIVNIYLKGCGQIKVGVAKHKFPAREALAQVISSRTRTTPP